MINEWSVSRRETGLIEHICKHGIGHPNVGSMARLDYLYGPGSAGTWGVHGCDGCCSEPDYPGNIENTLKFSWEIYSEGWGDRLEIEKLDYNMCHFLDELLKELDAENDYGVKNWVQTIGERMSQKSDEEKKAWRNMEEILYWALIAAENELSNNNSFKAIQDV